MPKYCPACGTPQNGQTLFCTHCGAPLAPTGQPDIPADVTDPGLGLLTAPAAPDNPPGGNRKTLWVVLAALGALLAVIVGVALALTSGSATPKAVASSTAPGGPPPAPSSTTAAIPTKAAATTPAPAPKPSKTGPSLTEQAQGHALEGILQQTAPARQLVISALASVDNCIATQSTFDDLNRAISIRNSVLAQLGNLQLTALPNASLLRTSLVSGESASVNADQHYLNWAQNGYSCSGQATHDSEYDAASAASATATASKNTFIATWNPVARTLNLPAHTSLDL